jgi:hypothetical protein
MANDNNKNPAARQSGETRLASAIFIPATWLGRSRDAKQTDESRGELHDPEEKPAD